MKDNMIYKINIYRCVFRLCVTGSCAWAALVTEAGRYVMTMTFVPASLVLSIPLASPTIGVLMTEVLKSTDVMSTVLIPASIRKPTTGLFSAQT